MSSMTLSLVIKAVKLSIKEPDWKKKKNSFTEEASV